MKNLQVRRYYNSIFLAIFAIFTVAIVFTMTTLAFFFYDAWAVKGIKMAGPVIVTCVGSSSGGYTDISGAGNLEITIPDITNKSVLIPNMPVGLRANAKIAYAKSIAVLRAKIDITFTNSDTFLANKTQEEIDAIHDLFLDDIEAIDTIAASWVKVDDYWYYVGSNERNAENTLLVVIDHKPAAENTTCDYVDDDGNSYIKFIDNDFRVPMTIDSSWSDLEVVISITFEAVQGFIPDLTGNDIGDENKTISRALPIFNNENVTI